MDSANVLIKRRLSLATEDTDDKLYTLESCAS